MTPSPPQPIVFRHSIGWLAVVTVPSAVFGGGLIALGVALGLGDRSWPPELIGTLLVLGLLAVLLFGSLSALRWTITLDVQQRTVFDRLSLLGCGRTRPIRFEEFTAVWIVPSLIRGAHAVHRRFKLYLASDGPRPRTVYLAEYRQLTDARRAAQRAAHALGRPCIEHHRPRKRPAQ